MKNRRGRSVQSLFFSLLALFALHPVHSAVSGNTGNRLAASPGAAVVGNIASTLTVTSGNDSGPGTLRQAISDAMDGDTIQFAAGLTTITLTSGAINITKSLTISGPGAGVLTVKRDSRAAPFQNFTINFGTTVSLSGLTISGGAASFGGGISNSGTLTISNSIIAGNDGGGIFNGGNNGATLTISNSTISDNSVPSDSGGGIFNYFGSTLTLINNTISGNSARYGGGIFNGGTLTISNNIITGNSGGDLGGAGISNGGGTLTISNSTISDNSTLGGSGGGIWNTGKLMISNTTISGNSAINFGFGGGVLNGGTATISNSTIAGNLASLGGGGIINGGTLTINNSTIYDNSTTYDYGGGIENQGTMLNLNSSIVANNTAPPGGPDIFGAVTTGDYNLIKNISGISGSLPGTHNLTGVDPRLGPLQNNGGPTPTKALLAGSPAIDQGKNFTAATNDQRGVGFVRTFDDPAVMNAGGGDGTDIGAFEVQPRFNLCIQDDGSGNLLQINTTTGEYQFTNCGGLTVGGTGTLTKRGSLITLQHNASDRRVMATIDTTTNKATASLQLLSQGRTFSITDRNITNNTCACR